MMMMMMMMMVVMKEEEEEDVKNKDENGDTCSVYGFVVVACHGHMLDNPNKSCAKITAHVLKFSSDSMFQ